MEPLAKYLREYNARSKDNSWESIGAVLGKSGEAVRLWSTGKTVPSADMIPALAEFLGVDVYELLGLVPPGGPSNLSHDEKMALAVIRVLGVDPKDVVRACYDLPRPPMSLDTAVKQLGAYNFAPDVESEPPPPAKGGDERAGNGGRKRGK
jgi:transcriptional regulator with XRE-family HTH domain